MVNKQQKPLPLTLYPLKFEEVISDVLKVRPEPKSPRKKATTKKRGKQSS